MYADPFRLRPYPVFSKNAGDILICLQSLLQLLLRSLPQEHVSELLRAAYLPDQMDQDQDQDHDPHQAPGVTTSIPYSSFTTDIDFQQYCFSRFGLGIFHPPTLPSGLTFKDYLERSGHADRHLAEYSPSGPFMPNIEIIHLGAARALRRDLTWALCTNAERIQRIVIPISDITRYFAMVKRFKTLSNITFLMERALQHREDLTAEQQEIRALQRADRVRHLEEMVLFVQEHQRQHRNILRVARCIKDVFSMEEDCPKEYQDRLVQAMPPLFEPRFIDSRNWCQFVPKVNETDLSFVELFSTRDVPPQELSLDRILKQGPFLQRCRSLRTFEMLSPGEDAFQWAADERKRYIADTASGQTPRRPLVPLRSIHINYDYPSTGRQINDVGFAFQDTLEDIFLAIHSTVEQSSSEPHQLLLGDSHSFWDLPRLNILDVTTNYIFLHVHKDFLQRCSQATCINLDDMRQVYSPDEIVHWKPAKLAQLEILTLCGTPALSFHPATLKYTPELQVLRLSIQPDDDGDGETTFIPPAEMFQVIRHSETSESDVDSNRISLELVARWPAWTWDWELPKLTQLLLTGEFGYRFQLKMLDRTPNLESLQLYILSRSGEHERTVCLQDLLKPGSQDNNNDSNNNNLNILDDDRVWEGSDFMHLPALSVLTLYGSWRMDKRVLNTLFRRMMPGISTLIMSSCLGHEFSEWVDATRTHLHELFAAEMKMVITEEMIAEAGLAKPPGLGGMFQVGYDLDDPSAGRTLSKPAIYQLYC
ncbi:hypothetical protein BGW39_008017 [Mortierella sp. 14UC]|nr:hypothetical protein BGW39_008017 [Mortierella sp. 14UC]